MTTFFKQRITLMFAAALTLGALSAASPAAWAQGDEASLERGAVPDMTPQQRYQSAIREAGGGLKVSLEECRAMVVADRKGCESLARSRYQNDMSAAKAMLRNPSAGPINVVGGPIRSTETIVEIRK